VIYINSVLALHCARYIRLPPAPALLHVHEMGSALDAYTQPVAHLFRDWPRRYIAVSEAVSQSLVERCGIVREKISVIHAFVTEKELLPHPASPTSTASTPLIVGGAGRISWCKGPTLWLLMAAELTKMLGEDRVRFVWVGVASGEDDRRFREMAHKLHLGHLIEFVPVTPRPLEHFARFDVFAMTSWEDSCPLVVLENMLLQKPVVCFAGGGGALEEVGDAGIVIEEFNPSAMAQAIADLAASPEERAALGRAARQRALEQFTVSVQAPKILSEIERLTPRRSGH
jgi:glycosyltransferase involved in cell wall biosynthesis